MLSFDSQSHLGPHQWSSFKRKVVKWDLANKYRQLNNSTKNDSYPIPRIDDKLNELHGNVFSFFFNPCFRIFSDNVRLTCNKSKCIHIWEQSISMEEEDDSEGKRQREEEFRCWGIQPRPGFTVTKLDLEFKGSHVEKDFQDISDLKFSYPEDFTAEYFSRSERQSPRYDTTARDTSKSPEMWYDNHGVALKNVHRTVKRPTEQTRPA